MNEDMLKALLSNLSPEQLAALAEPQTAEKAAKEKHDKHVVEKAKIIGKGLYDAYEDLDIPDEVVMQLMTGMAYTMTRQYFWSRRNADRAYDRIQQLQDSGTTHGSWDDGANGAHEINPTRDAEDSMRFAMDVAAWYEALGHAARMIWERASSKHYQETGREPTFILQLDMSEAAYSRFLSENNKRFQQRQQQNTKSSQEANAKLMRTSIPTWVTEEIPQEDSK